MDLLTALARRILLPPLVILTLTAAWQFFQGNSIDLVSNAKGIGLLTGFVLAIWVPLPLVRHISNKAPERWQSLVRIMLGITFASIPFGFLAYLVLRFDLLGFG